MGSILKISDAASLGLHAMAYLSNFGHSSPIAKVMGRLTRAGLVASKRGPKGGFLLTKDPAEISLLQIYEAVEGPLPAGHCLLNRPVCNPEGCVFGTLLQDMHAMVAQKFAETTLAEFRLPERLIERPVEASVAR